MTRKKLKLEQVMKVTKPKHRIVMVWQNPIANEQRDTFFNDHIDKDIVVTYKVVGDIKSIAQMGFYRGAVLPALCKYTGNMDRASMHTDLKKNYGEVDDIGEPLSLSEYSKPEFAKFIDDCVSLLIDCGGRIDPQVVDEYESVMMGNIEGQQNTSEEV